MLHYANNLSTETFRGGEPRPKQLLSIDEAIMFVTFYEEDGIKGWRFPTYDEALDNNELIGCWHQDDLKEEWPSDERYYVRPVRDE